LFQRYNSNRTLELRKPKHRRFHSCTRKREKTWFLSDDPEASLSFGCGENTENREEESQDVNLNTLIETEVKKFLIKEQQHTENPNISNDDAYYKIKNAIIEKTGRNILQFQKKSATPQKDNSIREEKMNNSDVEGNLKKANEEVKEIKGSEEEESLLKNADEALEADVGLKEEIEENREKKDLRENWEENLIEPAEKERGNELKRSELEGKKEESEKGSVGINKEEEEERTLDKMDKRIAGPFSDESESLRYSSQRTNPTHLTPIYHPNLLPDTVNHPQPLQERQRSISQSASPPSNFILPFHSNKTHHTLHS
jgi:hypothetical protein